MIIGIHGKLGSGKDTAAKMLSSMLGSSEILKFAHGVKVASGVIAGTPISVQHTQEGKASIPEGFKITNGEIQQLVGTELGRLIDPNIWVLKVAKRVAKSDRKHVIISDVRFKNEVDWIYSQGGIVIKINGDPNNVRFDQPWLNRYLDGNRFMKWYIDVFHNKSGRNLRHQSEIDLDRIKFKHVINNKYTLNYLSGRLKSVLHYEGIETH